MRTRFTALGLSLSIVIPVWGQTNLPPGPEPWVVRAFYPDRNALETIAGRNPPWEVRLDRGYAVLEVDGDAYRDLVAQGFRLEVDETLTKTLHHPPRRLAGQGSGIPGFPCYRTVEETLAAAQQLANDFPHLATLFDVGDSWAKTQNLQNGYDLLVLKMTRTDTPGPKPRLLITSAIHAREYTTAELTTRFAEYLVTGYGTDPDATWLLDYHEVHILFQANPDGRKEAEGGLLWRKNKNNNYCANTNSRGADLNRNFDWLWNCCGGSSGDPCDPTYRGTAPGSEPEVEAIQNYVLSQFPDQRGNDQNLPAPDDATGIFLDIHSYSELILWPWGHTFTPAPNGAGLQTLGRKLAFFNGYRPQQASDLYPTDGTNEDFAYGQLGVASYTFELGTSFFQNCATFEETIFPDNLAALVYAAKVTRTPYLTPSGPDVFDIGLDPVAGAPGDAIDVTAQASDERFNQSNGAEPTQNVAGATAYVNVPPWDAGAVGVAMAAVDGAFDSGVEAVTLDLDTSGLPEGRHQLFLVAQDANGSQGAVNSAFFYVLDPQTAPRIEGVLRDAVSQVPVGGTVRAQTFQTGADPQTGAYSLMLPQGTYDVTVEAPGYAAATEAEVVAQNQTVTMLDFLLNPICAVFEDDVEAGNQGWNAASPWGITDADAYGPGHSWTDSPGGNYGNNRNIALTSPVLDCSSYQDLNLRFWHRYNLETNYDYGYVEYSIDGGNQWLQAAVFNGNEPNWQETVIALPQLDGVAAAQIRFRLTTDSSVTRDGWYVDDIRLVGGSTACSDNSLESMLPLWPDPFDILSLVLNINNQD